MFGALGLKERPEVLCATSDGWSSFQLFKCNSIGLAEVQNAGRGQGRKVARIRPSGVDRGNSPDTDGVIERR